MRQNTIDPMTDGIAERNRRGTWRSSYAARLVFRPLARFRAVISVAVCILTASAALANGPPAMITPGQFDVSGTGAFTYALPIEVPPGTAGIAPMLSLDYSSQNGDGLEGWGWALGGLPSIGRCSQTVAQDGVHGGVNYDSNDRFCLNGQRLVVVGGTYGAPNSEYRTEIETFSKIIAYSTAGTGPSYFKVWTKSGQVLEFGNTTDSRFLAVGTATARAWAVNKVTDSKGNYFTVTYNNNITFGQANPTRIDYTGNATAGRATYNSVQFTYANRNDAVPTYQAGSLMQTTVVLTNIRTYQGSNLVSDYRLAYRAGTTAVHSRLTSVTRCDTTETNCLAPTSFTWQGGTGTLPSPTPTTNTLAQGGSLIPGEFNGDGLTDAMVNAPSNCDIFSGTSSGTYVDSGIVAYYDLWEYGTWTHGWTYAPPCFPIGAVGRFGYTTPDFTGDGLTDVALTQYHSATVVWQHFLFNDGAGTLAQLNELPWQTPNLLADFNGDGRTDYFGTVNTLTGYYLFHSNGDGTFDGGTYWDSSPTYYTGDYDGDGCADLLQQSSATHQINYSCAPAVSTASVPYWSGARLVFGDFNGDGKTDVLVTYPSAPGALYLSTGTGLVLESGYSVPSDWGKYTIVTGDWDGDGKTDIALIAAGGSGMYTYGTPHSIYLSTGVGFTFQTSIANNNSSDTLETPVVADWNNDGAADIWLQKPSGDTIYSFAYTPELMVGVSNGIGASTSVIYDRLNQNSAFYTKQPATVPTVALDGPYYVVKEIDTSNGIGGTYRTTYSYAGAFGNLNSYYYSGVNAYGNGHSYAGFRSSLASGAALGFAAITATDPQTGIVTETDYHTDFPYIGRISKQTQTSGAVTLSQVINTWAATTYAGTHNFVYLTVSFVARHDLDGTPLPGVATTYTYDAYGNPTSISTTPFDGSSRTVTNTIYNDTTNWLLGQITAVTDVSIWGGATLTRHYSIGHDAASGLVNQTIIEPTHSGLALETDYTLDAFGNRTQAALSGSGITTRSFQVGYDANGEFATSTTNALSQSDATAYNSAFGGPTNHTDLNGLHTTASYDGFGRPTLITNADGTKVAYSYQYCSGVNGGTYTCPTGTLSPGAVAAIATPYAPDGVTQNGPFTITFYDALGRVIATDTQGFNASTIRIATQYDANLRVAQTSRPYFVSGGTVKWTGYAYDALGRVTTTTFPDTTTATNCYHGLITAVTNSANQTTTNVANSHGQTATVKQGTGLGTGVNACLPATTLTTTSYVYDGFGNLTSVTDPSGNVITNTFDIRGRKTASSDPDMGNWSYGYDVLSELTSQTDAKSQNTTIAYDLLQRPLTRTESGFYSNWTYGASVASRNVGQLVETKSCDTSACATVYSDRTFIYDSLARASSNTLTANGASLTYATSYNSVNGGIDTISYPSGFAVRQVYTALGYLSQVKDTATGTAYWTANARDAELHLTSATAGNGITTTQTFDPTNGLISAIQAGTSGAVANFSYGWDITTGNLTSRTDANESYTERFCYDGLNRLTDVAMGAATTCTTGTNHKVMGYDALGNLTSKTGVGTYTYGGGTAGPHAVTSIAGTVNGVVNPTYSYDLNGNMSSGGGRTITPTAFNMAASVVQGGTSFCLTYDSSHARVTQTQTTATCIAPGSSASTTVYANDPVSGAMEEAATVGGVPGWKDYIIAAGTIVAQRSVGASTVPPVWGASTWGSFTWTAGTATTAVVLYVIGDNLDSTSVQASAAGSVTERDSYDAWGLRRNANGTDAASCTAITSAMTRGFTAQEHIDPACAINFNARLYDPTLGRFLSADSIVPDSSDSQSFNRYSYVNNGPLSATDPTGHACNDPNPQAPCHFDTPNPSGYGPGDPYDVPVTAPPTGFHGPGLPSGTSQAGPGGDVQNISGTVVVTHPRERHVIMAGFPIITFAQIGSAICYASSSLGQNGRLRLGGDFAGGIGPFVKGGLGVSLRSDLSIEIDVYFGGGGGLGVFGGFGLGVDNAGAVRGLHGNVGRDITAAAGVPVIGPIGISGSVTVPVETNYSNLTVQPAQTGSGIGVGPKYGLAAGAGFTGTATYRTGGFCQ